MKKLSILFLSLFVLVSCSKDDDNETGTDKEVEKSSAKEIVSFTFLASDNDGLSEDVKATIDKEKKAIQAEVPSGTNIKALKPTIALSEKSSVAPKEKVAIDFSEAVNYTVTAEDGSKAEYKVAISLALTDREILEALYNANPDNTLGWDLDEDISRWKGVTTVEGRVTKLWLEDTKLESLPASMGKLKFLSILNLEFNVLTILPLEIGNLSNLTELRLSKNSLTSIPSEIGNLSNLEVLWLPLNSLTSVPSELGNLSNLISLNLSSNENLTSIPTEIGNLTNLSSLIISNIGIANVPSEIGNLSNLEQLYLGSNDITVLPKEFGRLSSLTYFNIVETKITTIPKEICDLNIEEFPKDDGVICEE